MELLGERLSHWAALKPNEPAVVFLQDGETETDRLSFAALERSAFGLATRLMRAGLTGERVLLPAQPDRAFVIGIFGCLAAGAIAVPTPLHGRSRRAERMRAILRSSGAAAVVGTAPASARFDPVGSSLPWIEVAGGEAEPGRLHTPHAGEAALLQYTSGTTAAPKGICLSHGNLAANLEMSRQALGIRAKSRWLSWLPLFHDMGLTCLLLAIYCGITCVLMPPLSFLQRPQRWLWALARYRATISGAPNFAYELCARRLEISRPEPIDLSRWEVAFCGAERVRWSTMDRFARASKPLSFQPSALFPCYGMAEATALVSGGPAGSGIRTASIAASARGTPIVSCGAPAPGSTVVVVNPASRTPLADGQVGEIWVAGPHVATGYWNDAPATDADFGAGLAPAERGAFLRTGDLGFMLDGEIYVTGRRKSIIVHRGGNIQPEDIEDSVRGSHAVYADAGVAFAIEEAGDEQVVVAFEIQRVEADSAGSFRAATERALAAVAEDHGLRLYDVVFLPPYALPKTSSGKIQRDRCRALYSAGELGSLAPDLRHPSLGRYAAPATDGAGSGTTA